MIFFLLALLPIAVWGIQWYFNREIVWKEAAIGTGAALLVATIFTGIGATDLFVPSDVETRSGQVHYAQYQPAWREQYEEAIYRTETYDCGTSEHPQTCTRQVFSHYETRRRWHHEQWWVETELGTFSIDVNRYDDVLRNHGDAMAVEGRRRTGEHDSHMIEGDPNDYRTVNATGYIYPVTKNTKFDNRLLKAKDSLYNFEPVPEDQMKGLFPEWPANASKFDTDRLLGTASALWNPREWDQMNAVLGPAKRVNLIAIGFPAGTTQETGTLQERLWMGGKKNDLVLTYGGDPQEPDWAYVFGWTDKQAVKRLIENRILDGLATTEEISNLVIAEYTLCEFEEKLAHIEIPTPWWYYLIFAIVVIASQGTAHFIFSSNYETKDPVLAPRRTYGRRRQRNLLTRRR